MKNYPLLISAAAIVLSACAAPARVENMVAPVIADVPDTRANLVEAVCVTDVTGGQETNPLWTSEVDSDSFRAAIQQSLRNYRLAALDTDDCQYDLEANLLGLAQPIAGFNLEVTSHANYRVIEHSSGASYFLTTITANHTATVGDAFLAVERLRVANEGSILQNIQQFIAALLAHEPPIEDPADPTGEETGSPGV